VARRINAVPTTQSKSGRISEAKESEAAIKRGVQGIVVSNYGGLLSPGLAPPMEMLLSITDAVAGRVPVLIDGNFRRGSDIFKALAYGATAVMIGRPIAWGLAAYGPEKRATGSGDVADRSGA
jgi:isopentenyl diphosphate isomerase/L-lactate dehydrogenase-like FMN-dependent dehydrogenase